MKILNLSEGSRIYTSNAYLVTGTWNTLEDINTLVDTGRDSSIIDRIYNASTGVGKRRVERVILTHSHYDHIGMTGRIKQEFNARVFAFSGNVDGIDQVVEDGEIMVMGDAGFEVIHMPGHSTDSICLYSSKERVLFAGDSPLIIKTKEGVYEDKFISVLERLVSLEIERIYFGHGKPLTENCSKVLENSLKNVNAAKNYDKQEVKEL